MDPTLDTTLSHVLEPLEDAVSAVPEPDVSVAPLADVMAPPPETPVTRQRKARNSSTPGSNADSRRREANRLAAERSRGRQQEKIVALEMAVQALGDENLRLKNEVARLEGREREEGGSQAGAVSNTMGVDHALTETTVAAVEAAAAAAAVAAADTQAQQDSHSRNILAALLSGAGGTGGIEEALGAGLDGDADGEAANWMRGVESLFKEAEASGRLGELAAVAAGEGSEAVPHDAVLGDVLEDNRARQSSAVPMPALGATTSAIALAINNETEKLLRDDIAQTKAAIARVEREMARLRGQPVYDDAIDGDQPLSSTLPEGIIGADDATVRARDDEMQGEITKLESEASVLREVVSRMRDAHTEESDKVKALAADLRALGMDGGERERDQVSMVLRALRAQITTLMSVPGGDFTANPLVTPFSSPATARRRRGRPPKHGGLPAVKYVYSSVYPSPSTPGVDGSMFPETPTARPGRATRKSGLAHEILAQEAVIEAGPSTEVDVGVSSQAAHAHAHDDYLLSHLTEAADGRGDGQIPLDSSSFAAFLPQSPTDAAHAHQQLESTLAAAAQAEETVAQAISETPNILSRLKRGPPGSCDICGRTQTSVWRKLSLGGEDHKVCNACGLYHTKFGIIRPPELWGDGKSVKKRKASARTSTAGYDSPNGAKRKRKSAKFGNPYDEQVHELAAAGGMVDNGDMGAVVPGAEASDPQSLGDVGRAVENMFASVV